DPTLVLRRDPQTGEQLLSGMSQMHVEVAVDRLHSRFGVDVELHQPQVPYLETIRKESRARHRYKKQTGGRGQFGDCEIVLEPLMEVDGSVPDDAVGAVNGDLNSRRGRLQGMEPRGGMTSIKAEVPMAEILTYSQALTSLTGGRGDYHMHFLRYEEVPSHIAQHVIAESQTEREAAKV